MPLIKSCHERAREMSTRVATIIKIEDEEGATGKLTGNVRSIEEKLGRELSRTGAAEPMKAETEASVAAEEDLSIAKD